MFEEFFGFTRTPFARDLEAQQLFRSGDNMEATARLRWAISQKGPALLTGDVGSGKSTCLRALRASIDPVRHRWLYLSNPLLGIRGLFRQMLVDLGTQPPYHRADVVRQLMNVLWTSYQQDKMPLIIIDDAHLLSEASLQELRLLTNFHTDTVSPMTLILAGQTSLRDRLRLTAYDHFTQRLTVGYHMRGLTAPETKDYIAHHLKVAGHKAPLFTPEAVQEVFQYSRGIPRRINRLCTGALLAARIEEKQLVDHRLVLRVITDLNGTA